MKKSEREKKPTELIEADFSCVASRYRRWRQLLEAIRNNEKFKTFTAMREDNGSFKLRKLPDDEEA